MDVICPGQNTLFWKPEDVFETECPVCGGVVEFFKDDASRKCPQCGFRFPNPRLDLGCMEWCPYADRCAAAMAEGKSPGIPAGGTETPGPGEGGN